MVASRPWESSGGSAETKGHLVGPEHLKGEFELAQYSEFSLSLAAFDLEGAATGVSFSSLCLRLA